MTSNACGQFPHTCFGPQKNPVYTPQGSCTALAPAPDGARLCTRSLVDASGGDAQQYRASGGTFSCSPDQMPRLAGALIGTSATSILPNTVVHASVARFERGTDDCAAHGNHGSNWPCALVTQKESDVLPSARDQCCRNAGAVIACDVDAALSRCNGTSVGGTAPYAVTGDAQRVQANLYCSPAHCWTGGSDACDDVMATLAAKPKHADSKCQELPYPSSDAGPVVPGQPCATQRKPPPACSNITATVTAESTGGTVGQWFNTAQKSASQTRRAMADYAALAYCDAHPTDETCACLNASFSGYKEPCLGKTYTQLLTDFESAFGAAAVTTSGIVSRKACWWAPCDATGASRFLQTTGVAHQNAHCPSTDLCITTVRNLNVQDPSDVVCIVQNCSSQDCDTVARTVRAIVDEKGALPRATGQECGGCNDTINAALVGTGFSVPPWGGGGTGSSPTQPSGKHTKTALIVGIVVGVVAACVVLVVVLRRRRRRRR